jgi:predicted ATPase
MNNLPTPSTRFVGRETEVVEVADCLWQSRLVTVTGSAGLGKTRLATHVATRLRDLYRDGVWFVDLSPITDPLLVPSAIASIFNLEDAGGTRPLMDTLLFFLRPKRLLLVLDNCENVAPAAAAAAKGILTECPDVRVIATSRTKLDIENEHNFELAPLPEADSVALFVDRARAAMPEFTFDPQTGALVNRIVSRLGGIALAIELAAPRVKILGIEHLAERLEVFEKSGGFIGWSYDLLSEPERSLMRQLAIFRTGFSLDAAQAVCENARYPDWDVPALLAALCDASLVVRESEDTRGRYRLLEPTRQYAFVRLEEAGELHAVEQRHCAFFRDAAQRAWSGFFHLNLDPWLLSVRTDLENYRAAISFASRAGDVESAAIIGASLTQFWYEASRAEGRALMQRLLAELPENAHALTRAKLQLALAELEDTGRIADVAAAAAHGFERHGDRMREIAALKTLGKTRARGGNLVASLSSFERALLLAREENVSRMTALVLVAMGNIVGQSTGDRQRGRAMLEEGIQIFRSFGDGRRTVGPLSNLAENHFCSDDVRGALELAGNAMALAREVGSERVVLLLDLNCAAYSLALGDLRRAWTMAREAIEIATRREQTFNTAIALQHLAEIALVERDYETAGLLTGYTDATYVRSESTREPTERAGYERLLHALRRELSPKSLQVLFARGAALTEQAAISLALKVPRPQRVPA